MKMKEFVKEAEMELQEEKKDMAKGVIKETLKEISLATTALNKLKTQYEKLLEKDVDEIVVDEDDY